MANAPKEAKHLLFVCTINRHRSVIAEYIFRDLLEKNNLDDGNQFIISSAGIVTHQQKSELKKEGLPIPRPLYGYRPMPCVILYMQKEGLDTSEHRSKAVTKKMVKQADLIIGMNDGHKERVLAAFPEAKGKTLSFGELSWPFEIELAGDEPPGLMPPARFCMLKCDHWPVTGDFIKEVKLRKDEALKNIITRLV